MYSSLLDFESVMASFYEHVGGGAPSSEDDDEGIRLAVSVISQWLIVLSLRW